MRQVNPQANLKPRRERSNKGRSDVEMAIDVTGSNKTFKQLSELLGVEKFGVLDDEGDWGYVGITEEGNEFAFESGLGWAEACLPHFPLQSNVTPAEVVSKTIFQNGSVVFHKVIKVLAYED